MTCKDFEEAVSDAGADDFVFFDSPYAPLNPTSFRSYTKEGFKKEDHIRLAEVFTRLERCVLYAHKSQYAFHPRTVSRISSGSHAGKTHDQPRYEA